MTKPLIAQVLPLMECENSQSNGSRKEQSASKNDYFLIPIDPGIRMDEWEPTKTMKTGILVLPTMLAAILTSCTTQQTPVGSPEVIAQIRKYDTATVLTFANRTSGQLEKHRAAAVASGRQLADEIASEIRKTGSFRNVTRSNPGGEALLISGEITQYDEGNKFWRVAAGSLGVGKAHFGATIDLSDHRTGKRIHRMNVGGSSRTPLPIYGDTAWYEDPDYMMEGIARQLAAKLAEARNNPSQSEQ